MSEQTDSAQNSRHGRYATEEQRKEQMIKHRQLIAEYKATAEGIANQLRNLLTAPEENKEAIRALLQQDSRVSIWYGLITLLVDHFCTLFASFSFLGPIYTLGYKIIRKLSI